MNQWIEVAVKWSMVFMTAGLAVLLALYPKLSQRDVYFGVTVAPDFRHSKEARKALTVYVTTVLVFGGAAVLMALLGTPEQKQPLLVLAPFLVVFGAIAGYVAGHRMTVPHRAAPTAVRQVSLARRRESLPGGPLAQVGPFLLLATASAWTILNWHRLPAHFPIHWGGDGLPDGWTTRTPYHVFSLPVFFAGLCLFLALTAFSVLRYSRRSEASDAWGRFRRTLAETLLALEYCVAVSAVAPMFLPLSQTPATVKLWTALLLVLSIVLPFTLVIVLLVAVSRATSAQSKPATAAPEGDGTPDACWHGGGIFYYNPHDPALWVRKRFGIGYTLNFANPWSWVFMGGTVVLVAAPLLLLP